MQELIDLNNIIEELQAEAEAIKDEIREFQALQSKLKAGAFIPKMRAN